MALTQILSQDIKDLEITNSDISTTAAIATTKLADGSNFLRANGSVVSAANQDAGGFRITNLGAPTGDSDAARKLDVDAAKQGLDAKDSCRVATTAALPAVTAAGSGVGKTLTASAVGVLTIDGVATVLNDRILVKNQVAGVDNGIYKVTTEGTAVVAFVLTRAIDADANADVTSGLFTFIEVGTVNADIGYVLTTDNPITVDTTSLVFTQFSGLGQITAGTGLTKTGNTIDAIAGVGIVVNTDDIAVKPDITGGANLATVINAVTNGVSVKIDDSTVGTNGSNQLIVKASGITSTQLSTGIAGGGIAGGGGTALSVDVSMEAVNGTINGSNTAFTLTSTPNPIGTQMLFRNGLYLEAGAGNDYTISGVNVTMASAPVTGSKLTAVVFK